MPQKAPIFDQIKTWLSEVDGVKTASAKKEGKAALDPGGYTGATTHPSKDVDNSTFNATEGPRAKENEKDIKEDVGEAAVNNTASSSGKSQDDVQIQVGTTKSETGGQPSVEDDYKGDKDDPGTSHPANADDVGGKYASVHVSRLLNMQKKAGDELLAAIAVSVDSPGPTKSSTPETKTAAANQHQPTQQSNKSVESGYELAALFGLDKEAADKVAQQTISFAINEAIKDADRVGPFVLGWLSEQEKMAEEAASKKAADASGEEGEDHASAAGVPSPEAVAPDGVPGGAPPEGGEGGMSQDDMANQLIMAILELGMSPEQIAQRAVELGGAGGGGGPAPGPEGGMPGMPGGAPMPPEGGGAPMPGSPADMGAKIASIAMDHMRSGKFRFEPAKTAAERRCRDEMKSYIRELMQSGRR